MNVPCGGWTEVVRALGVSITLASLWLSTPALAGELSRQDVILIVVSEHPSARQSRFEAEAANSRVAAEGAFPPVMVDAGVAPGALTTRPGVQASAAWTLPLWGMRDLAVSAASSRAEMARAAQAMTLAELAAWTSILIDDWRLATERLRVLDHHVVTMAAARSVVANRVGAGLAPPAAESMAQMALLDLRELRIVVEADLGAATATFEALTGLPADALSTDIAPLGRADAPPPQGPTPTERMATAESAMRADMAQMAIQAGRPMVTPMVALNTMWPDPMDWAMVGVGVSVPMDRGALRAAQEAAAAEQMAAEAGIEGATRTLDVRRAEVAAMLAMAEAMEALLATEVEPLAVEQARLARSAWEQGLGPVSDWLEAENGVLEVQWRIAAAQADRSRAIAMAAMLEGQTLGLPGNAQ